MFLDNHDSPGSLFGKCCNPTNNGIGIFSQRHCKIITIEMVKASSFYDASDHMI